MTDTLKRIGYRLMEERDRPAILRLWTEDTEWGAPGAGISSWYASNPNQGSLAVVAVDENNEAVGQFIFMAAEVFVNGRAHQALRPIAPIVARSFRFIRPERAAQHPMAGMRAYAEERARN